MRTSVFTWILILCLSTISAQSNYHSQHDPEEPKLTNLHFFLHEAPGGSNPTVAMIAQSNITVDVNNSSMPFGTVYAVDDPLRVGPEPNSELIGNAQGLTVIIAGRSTPPSVLLHFDFGFTTGKFNGSSISVLSRNPTTDMERELTVVGGRGKFRMAKGFAHLKVYSANATVIIAELNVTVIHYEGRSEI
ncbi:Disease resistance-responsive family protein [Hibiscus syriacus]|uniref:Dirigent protein n=1 Tax=Hibiscus syriacus TaxID=106335 RepID=A0A6A3A353_HIBSY|nr:dirigent protein 4-like [Hibiscus syriacus]KAE8698721.1 Disease resistance-responsive family protein [Hibiscus syriacus]